jgi:Tfp pilus assembly protein FimT
MISREISGGNKGLTRKYFVKQDLGGLTMIELVITLGIVLILAAVAIPLTSNIFSSARINETGETLAQDIHLVRTRSIARLNNSAHGIFFDVDVNGPDAYTLFQGDSYAARDQNYDKVVEIPDNMRLFTFIWPSQTLLFSRGLGTPSAQALITITEETTESGMRIYVGENGVVNFEPFGTGGSGGK